MDTQPPCGQKFSLGKVVATAGALAELEQSGQQPAEFLARHQNGDWGELCAQDAHLNDRALVDGSRILSVYLTHAGSRLWVITDAEDAVGQRNCTTLLLPQEY
jgi:hypothetical protein